MKQILQKNEGIQQIAEFIRNNDGFIIISHIAPDGDTLGSGLALYGMLKLYGKRVQIVCQDRVPQTLLFLPWAKEIINPDKAVREDNVISVDCADIPRLGKAQALFNAAKNTVNIDHHGTNTCYAMHNEIHPNGAANAEVVYELIRLYSGSLTADMATCLYAGFMTDTGCFAFSNTTTGSFEVAAELVRAGAKPAVINTLIYRTVSYAKTKLLGKALSCIELYDGGRIGMCIITQNDLNSCKAKADDTEGIIDHIRDIESVEIAIFIRECLDGDYKVSLRSKDFVDVAQLAQDIGGGGGHKRAAGFKLTIELDKLCDMLLDTSRAILAQDEE